MSVIAKHGMYTITNLHQNWHQNSGESVIYRFGDSNGVNYANCVTYIFKSRSFKY